MEFQYCLFETVLVVGPESYETAAGFTDGMEKYIGQKKKIIKRFPGFWDNGICLPSYILENGEFYSFRESWLSIALPKELFEI